MRLRGAAWEFAIQRLLVLGGIKEAKQGLWEGRRGGEVGCAALAMGSQRRQSVLGEVSQRRA